MQTHYLTKHWFHSITFNLKWKNEILYWKNFSQSLCTHTYRHTHTHLNLIHYHAKTRQPFKKMCVFASAVGIPWIESGISMSFSSSHAWKKSCTWSDEWLWNSSHLFIQGMGGQTGENLGSSVWNRGPKQYIMMWFLFHLFNFIQNEQVHAPTFPVKERQCTTDLETPLKLTIRWL